MTYPKRWGKQAKHKGDSMPIIIPKTIPAFSTLQERIFVMDTERATTQDIRPLEILIYNLMPTKIETENQISPR